MGASAEKRRVLYLSGYADLVGGGQVSFLLLLKHLDRERFLPILLCPREGEVSRRARDLGAEVYDLNAGESLDSLSAVRHALALHRRVRALDADLLHCDTVYVALMSGLGLQGLRVPVVFHARVSQSGGVYDAILPYLCAKILCVSHAAAQRFSPRFSAKVHVVYNGVDLSEFQPGVGEGALRERLGIDTQAFVVGYAGQLITSKGLDILMEAFSRLRAGGADARLLIAGRGPHETALRAAADTGVLFLPFSDAMPEFYSALDVFAFPTLHPEGLSRSLIESMACAVPSVATPLGGNAETVVEGETGFFVPAQDASALHDRLRDLYLAPERRRQMGRAARKRAEQLFDAAACARAVEALYQQVCP